MSFSSDTWLIGFRQPPLLFVLDVISAAFCIITVYKTRGTRIIALTCLVAFMGGSMKWAPWHPPAPSLFFVQKGNHTIPVVYAHGKIIVIDQGFCTTTPSGGSFITYQVMQAILKQTGHPIIDYYIALQPARRLFDALHEAITAVPIKYIIMPQWQGRLLLPTWQAYRLLCDTAHRRHCTITHCVDTLLPSEIPSTITLEPLQKKIPYETAHYALYACVVCTNGTRSFFYPAKEKRSHLATP